MPRNTARPARPAAARPIPLEISAAIIGGGPPAAGVPDALCLSVTTPSGSYGFQPPPAMPADEARAVVALLAAAPRLFASVRAVQGCPQAAPWLAAAGIAQELEAAVAAAVPGPPRPVLTLTWRDEDYGRISGKTAFRCYDIAGMGETPRAKLRAAFRRARFELDDGRASWMTDAGRGRRARLVAEVEALGYEVRHAGAWSPRPGVPDPDAPRLAARA